LSYEFDPDGRIARNSLGVVAASSPERFQEGARRLWQERNDRRELSERLRAYVDSTHGLDTVTGHWLELITNVREN
jgi:hypothetical protein